MKVRPQGICLLTVCLFLLTEGSQGSSLDAKDLSPAEEDESLSEEDSPRGEKIFAFYTSTSLTRLVTTTITAISTCLSVTSVNMMMQPPACIGRKRRSALKMVSTIDDYESNDPKVDSSMEVSENLEGQNHRVTEEALADGRTGRKLTIWSTAFTTITVTSTSALSGTTVTASLLCVLPGVMNSCFLG